MTWCSSATSSTRKEKRTARSFLRKSYAALRPGGKLLIAEYVKRHPHGTRDAAAVWLEHASANRGGNVFTLREYRTWLKAAGFRKLANHSCAPPSTVILATK